MVGMVTRLMLDVICFCLNGINGMNHLGAFLF